MSDPAPQESGTARRILDIAERLVQTQGFNGFSYADISAKLGITKASLHYHFASKAELGRTLMERYQQRFEQGLEGIDAGGGDARQKLGAYVGLYAGVLEKNRMCLCGMLAAEYATLPRPMQSAVTGFFDSNERWLGRVLEEGRGAGHLGFDGAALESARLVLSSLEGAMMVARTYGDVSRFRSAAEQLIARFLRTK